MHQRNNEIIGLPRHLRAKCLTQCQTTRFESKGLGLGPGSLATHHGLHQIKRNTTALLKKAQQKLYFLRLLRKNTFLKKLLVSFYRCSGESVLNYGISLWFASCTVAERKVLQRVINTAQKVIGALFHLLRTSIKHAASDKATASSETQHPLVTTYLNCCPQRGTLGPSKQKQTG